jgi:hypothetical protein
MARVKRGVTVSRQAQESAQGRQGLSRPAQEHDPHRQAGGGEGQPIRLPRPQAAQAHLPRACGFSASTRRCGRSASTTAASSRPRPKPASSSIARCSPTSPSPSRRRSRRLSARPSRRWRKALLLSAGMAGGRDGARRRGMIDRAYVQRMARYNRWQNENLYGVADGLPDEERRRERGAFFGSIHKTLSHLRGATGCG